MTILRAIQLANSLLKRDAEPTDTMNGVLDPQTREALAKLVTIATERAFGKNRGSR
jgi:hypothetical protein